MLKYILPMLLIGCGGNSGGDSVTTDHNTTIINNTHTISENNNTVYLPSNTNISLDIGYIVSDRLVKVEFISTTEITDNEVMLRHEYQDDVKWVIFDISKIGNLYKGVATTDIVSVSDATDRLCVRDNNLTYYVCEDVAKGEVIDRFTVYDIRDELIPIFRFNVKR